MPRKRLSRKKREGGYVMCAFSRWWWWEKDGDVCVVEQHNPLHRYNIAHITPAKPTKHNTDEKNDTFIRFSLSLPSNNNNGNSETCVYHVMTCVYIFIMDTFFLLSIYTFLYRYLYILREKKVFRLLLVVSSSSSCSPFHVSFVTRFLLLSLLPSITHGMCVCKAWPFGWCSWEWYFFYFLFFFACGVPWLLTLRPSGSSSCWWSASLSCVIIIPIIFSSLIYFPPLCIQNKNNGQSVIWMV